MRALPFLVIFLLPLGVARGFAHGGLFAFVTPFVVFGVVPLLDALLGLDTRNPSDDEARGGRWAFRLLTWLAVPVQGALVLGGAYLLATRPYTLAEIVGLTLSVGVTTGAMGITVAHELVHRTSRLDRFLGQLLLLLVGYMHWGIEHVAGHHKWVATPRDPATSRRGESVFAFVVRSVVGSYRSAVEIERTRGAERGRGPFHPRARMLWFTLLPLALGAALVGLLGGTAGAFFFGQSAVAVALLEVVNYVEHYGLRRREIAPGRYERVTPLHSWNASHRLTNWFLFNLQRHSDHHAYPQRPYETLRHFDESPQLPHGYATMVLLALVPPLWRRVMDPRVDGLAR